MIKQKWLKFRIALAGWIYTPPAPKHSVPDSFVVVDIPWRDEQRICTTLRLAHDAKLLVFSSSGEDRHLAAARAGFTIPPYKLRVTEFLSGAVMYDYSARSTVCDENTLPAKGGDPLAGEAEDFGFLGKYTNKRK